MQRSIRDLLHSLQRLKRIKNMSKEKMNLMNNYQMKTFITNNYQKILRKSINFLKINLI